MGMYIMNGKTFLKTYIKEDPKLVLDTQYVIISADIRKAGRYEKQVIIASNILYPETRLIIDYSDYKDPEYESEYIDQIMRVARPFLATLIQYCLDNTNNIVFLCSKREWEFRYLKLIRKFVLEEFGFHIYDYKKIKSGKEKIVQDDESLVYSVCRKILKKAKKAKEEKLRNSEQGDGIHKYVENLDKSDMIKRLKKKNLYIKGMSRSEMVETLSIFL